jgi:hypothetical protein
VSQVTIDLVEGWSAPLDFLLTVDGAPSDLTGLTLRGQAFNRLKNAVVLTSNVVTASATGGKVRLTPDTSDFLMAGSPYELRFYATQNGNEYWPSQEAIQVLVRR